MNPDDLLNPQKVADEVRARTQYETTAKHNPDNSISEFATSFSVMPTEELEWRDKIESVTKLKIPEDRQVILTDTRYWGDPNSPNVYAKFKIIDRPNPVGAVGQLDTVEILKSLRAERDLSTSIYDGDSTFVLSWNDWQVGKSEGGGTRSIIERVDAAIEKAVERAKELRRINRSLGRLVVIGGGDMLEGCFIFPNQSFQIDLDRRSQINVTSTMILDGLDRLAPYFSRVDVLVVPGNHGENRAGGHKVNNYDNDDCLVFEIAARATERDSRLSHVNYHIAQDEIAKTLNVNGWTLGTTHGQAFGKNPGGNAEIKAQNWLKGQKLGDRAVGNSDVFVTHHFHHEFTRDWGKTFWVQTPAMDGGSQHFTDFSGMSANPGMLSFVMNEQQRYTDAYIL